MIGLTVGLFQDLLTPGGIGLNMILKALAGGLAGVTTHTFSTVTSPAVLLVTFALSLGCGLASLVVAYPGVDGPGPLTCPLLRTAPTRPLQQPPDPGDVLAYQVHWPIGEYGTLRPGTTIRPTQCWTLPAKPMNLPIFKTD